jgi:hypothetical protein
MANECCILATHYLQIGLSVQKLMRVSYLSG